MALRPSSVPQRVALPSPPASSLPDVPDPESDLTRAASPIITRLLATVVTYPDFESTTAFSLVNELSESVCPLSVGGEPALGSDVLEDKQFELEFLAAALPRFASMLLCPEGDPDALEIPTPRSYADVIAAQRDYKLHSLDFSTAFLQSSLHKEIWLRRPPGFTGMTLAALGFAPSSADPPLFLRTDTTLPPFYVLVYVDDLVFATADTEALALVKVEL
ncbi:unnamed protein product [Closterium sp. NIES-53]